MINIYRLKQNHKNYKKGNLIYRNPKDNTFANGSLSVWKRVSMWGFDEAYLKSNPDIFEPLKDEGARKKDYEWHKYFHEKY